MKCLWITPVPSHPTRAGNRAYTKHLADSLRCEGFEVTYFLYGQESPSEKDLTEMRSYWDDFIYLPHRLHQSEKTCGEVWGIDDWFNKDLEIGVEFALRQRAYDVVVVDYVFMSKALDYVKGSAVKVLNTHDRMADRHELLEALGIPRDFFYTTAAEEQKALDRADIVLAIREDEAVLFRAQTEAAVLTVSHAVGSPTIGRAKRCLDDGNLLVGYMASKNSLNVRSLQSFVEALDSRPDIAYRTSLYLAGNICEADIDCRSLRVEKLGFVEDMNLFHGSVDVLVNPMVGGTGLKIKTVEALASGLPVIATKEGAAGIPSEAACLNHSDLRSVVEAIGEALADPGVLDVWRQDTVEAFEAYRTRAEREFQQLLRAIRTGGEDRMCLVTDVPFWEPGVGSHTRILKLVNSLAVHSKVDVFFYGTLWADRLAAVKAAAPEVQIYTYKDYEARQVPPVEDTFPNPAGLSSRRHRSWLNAFAHFLDDRKPYRLFIFEYIWLAYLASAIRYPAVRAIDTHDVMSRRELEFAAYGEAPNVSITLADEVSILEKFDVTIAIQEDEAAYLRRIMPNKVVVTVPFSENCSTVSLPCERVQVIGYVAANSPANVRGLEWFLENVWPRLQGLGVRFQVIGSICDSFLHLAERHVVLSGRVEDISTAYAKCDVMINPVLFGGGLKIKTVEAMLFGRTIVTTEEGAAGFSKKAPCGLIKIRSATEMAGVLERLVSCRGLARALGRENRRFIQTSWSDQASVQDLVALWQVLKGEGDVDQ